MGRAQPELARAAPPGSRRHKDFTSAQPAASKANCISTSQLSRWLARWECGRLKDVRGLAADGTWRSPVAHLNGVQGVAGSNPAVPIEVNVTPCSGFRCGALLLSGTGCYGFCHGLAQLPGLRDDLQERRFIRLLITLFETARIQPASGLGHILNRQVLPFGRPLPPIRMASRGCMTRPVPWGWPEIHPISAGRPRLDPPSAGSGGAAPLGGVPLECGCVRLPRLARYVRSFSGSVGRWRAHQ